MKPGKWMLLNAVFTSLGAWCATSFAASPPAPAKATPELLAKGKEVYQKQCASCHGEKGDGMGEAGMYLTPAPRNFIKDPFKQGDSVTAVYGTTEKGMTSTGMPAYPAPTISDQDRWGVAHYVLSFRSAPKNKAKSGAH